MSELPQLSIETDTASVAAMIREGEEFLLLDVREPDEYELAKIEGSLLLPMSQWADRAGELEPYRDQRIVVHCHHGGRSMQVTRALRRAGFSKAQNMAGGIDAWSLSIDANIPRY
jgi:rhodanese-related sulfurtransferase